MRRNVVTEVAALAVVLGVMVLLPRLQGDPTGPSAGSVMLFAVLWVAVRASAVAVGVALRRRRERRSV